MRGAAPCEGRQWRAGVWVCGKVTVGCGGIKNSFRAMWALALDALWRVDIHRPVGSIEGVNLRRVTIKLTDIWKCTHTLSILRKSQTECAGNESWLYCFKSATYGSTGCRIKHSIAKCLTTHSYSSRDRTAPLSTTYQAASLSVRHALHVITASLDS